MESILFTYEAIAFGFLIFPSIIRKQQNDRHYIPQKNILKHSQKS